MHWKKDDMVYKLGSSLLHICLCTFKHLMKYNNRLLFECCLSLFFTFSLMRFTTLSQYYLIVWPFLPSPVFSDFCCHAGLSAFSTPPFLLTTFRNLIGYIRLGSQGLNVVSVAMWWAQAVLAEQKLLKMWVKQWTYQRGVFFLSCIVSLVDVLSFVLIFKIKLYFHLCLYLIECAEGQLVL